MTDQTDATAPAPVAAPKPPAAEANGQLIVALAIVVALAVVAIGLIVAAIITKNWSGMITVGTIIGALATALNAPTGIGNVLRASKTGEGQ